VSTWVSQDVEGRREREVEKKKNYNDSLMFLLLFGGKKKEREKKTKKTKRKMKGTSLGLVTKTYFLFSSKTFHRQEGHLEGQSLKNVCRPEELAPRPKIFSHSIPNITRKS